MDVKPTAVKTAKVYCLAMAIGFGLAGASLTGCGKNETGISKSESERLHAPLGQPMPPEAREAMAKAMSKRGGANTTTVAPTATTK
jgi:hypothetical protein